MTISQTALWIMEGVTSYYDRHLLVRAHLLSPKRYLEKLGEELASLRRIPGRLIQSLCEAAAAAEGFTRLEVMPTLSGEPLYTGYGFRPLERLADATGGAPMPLVPMEKPVNPSLLG